MDQLSNILIGLATTFIGYVIGRLWQITVDRRPYRRIKRFWKPILSGDTQIIVSRFTPDTSDPHMTFEYPGLVGGGDALAMRELTTFFEKIHTKGVHVVYVDEPSVDRTKNLILVGGPGINAVTKDALDLLKPKLQFGYARPGLVEIRDLAPEPESDNGNYPSYTPEPGKDYGVIIRACNPFDSTKVAVILAGAYGHGTWAAAILSLQDWFAEQCSQLHSQENKLNKYLHWLPRSLMPQEDTHMQQLECVFRVQLFDKRPHSPEIIALRTLAPGNEAASV